MVGYVVDSESLLLKVKRESEAWRIKHREEIVLAVLFCLSMFPSNKEQKNKKKTNNFQKTKKKKKKLTSSSLA